MQALAARLGPTQLRPHLLLTLAFVFLALNVVVGRAVHADVPPVGLSFWRWTVASLLFLPFSLGPLCAQWRALLASWKLIALLSFLLMLMGNTLVYVGLQTTTALNGGLIPVCRPAIILVLAWLLFRGSVGPNQWLGIAVALLGVVLVLTRGSPAVLAGLAFSRGDLWILASSVGIAAYQACVARAPAELPPKVLLQATMTAGALMLLPVYLWESATTREMTADATTVLAVLYVAVFPSIFAMALVNRGIAEIGPARASVYNYLQPLFVALVAIPVLGEALRWYHPVALGVVVAGVLLASRRPAPRAG